MERALRNQGGRVCQDHLLRQTYFFVLCTFFPIGRGRRNRVELSVHEGGAKNLRSVDRALSKYPGAKLPERPWSCSATTAKSRRIHPSTWLGMVNKWTAGCVNSPPLSKVAEIRNHAT